MGWLFKSGTPGGRLETVLSMPGGAIGLPAEGAGGKVSEATGGKDKSAGGGEAEPLSTGGIAAVAGGNSGMA